MFSVTKSYGHELGLSCAFRQWRAISHCRLVHGYALAFDLTFEADELDVNNWVIDFGDLKEVKEFLVDSFDHKVVVALDDPEIAAFQGLDDMGLIDLRQMDDTGCEAFALYVWLWVNQWLRKRRSHARIACVTVHEHNGNAATFRRSETNDHTS